MTDLLLKALDLLVGGLLEKWRQRKALSGQLEALKRHIFNVSLMNNYPVELAKLRAFLIESGLVDKTQFKEFFQGWLSDQIVAEGRPVLGLLSSEQIAELLEELACLQL